MDATGLFCEASGSAVFGLRSFFQLSFLVWNYSQTTRYRCDWVMELPGFHGSDDLGSWLV